MPRQSTLHDGVTRSYILHAMLRDLVDPPYKLELDELASRLQTDMTMLEIIRSTRYLSPRNPTPRLEAASLSLVWEYAKDPEQHGRFQHMLRVSPRVFQMGTICAPVNIRNFFLLGGGWARAGGLVFFLRIAAIGLLLCGASTHSVIKKVEVE